MSAADDAIPSALVIHRDDRHAQNGNETSIVTASSENGIVLDALSYVEALDPNYEQYALSLVEAEMQQQQQQQQQIVDDDNTMHPTLRQSFGILSNNNTDTFAKRAPLAAAAYEALVQKKRRQQHHSDADGVVVNDTATTAAASDDDDFNVTFSNNITINSSSTIHELQTAINQSKIQHEYQRLRYTNLELHSLFETPQKYTSYLTALEQLYTNPTAMAVEQQRLVVDGINGTRMEEQSSSMNKLMGLQMKYGGLMDKNWRLGKALESLQSEVDGLEKQVIMDA
jgi:hypothetical protein